MTMLDTRDRPRGATFWATTCPACIREVPHLIELYEELSPQGLEIIGISIDLDGPEAMQPIVSALKIDFPVGH